MTKCKYCKFYNPYSFGTSGWCGIELPPWLATVVLTEGTNHRIIGPEAGCDLGKEVGE